MKRMKFRLIFCSLFLTVVLFAQRAENAETLFNNKQYAKARTVYEALLKQNPNSTLFNYRYARCCYELKDPEPAIVHFEKAGSKYPIRNLYLGELYFDTYRFDESVTAYNNFMLTLKPEDPKLADCQQKVKKAEMAARLLTKVDDITVVDSMVVDKSDFLRFYQFGSDIGTLSQEALKLKKGSVVDKIRYTTQRQDRVYYSDSIKGNMDIFSSYKLLDEWSQPVSVSDNINTSTNENYPFLLLDGITMYFASDGEKSIGGYDLFITRYTSSSGNFLTPENIGMPFNSPYNDYMMVIDEQRKIGWFATDRYQSVGKVVIYTFVPNNLKKIVHSEDKDYLRHAAQLRTYRKVSKELSDSLIKAESQNQMSDKQIEFLINDSVVYTHLNQFKSEEAAKLWLDLNKLSVNFKNNTNQLADLRSQYASDENHQKRMPIASLILELENKNVEVEKQLFFKTIQVRNMEIKQLQKKYSQNECDVLSDHL